jgi:hypothetical protein
MYFILIYFFKINFTVRNDITKRYQKKLVFFSCAENTLNIVLQKNFFKIKCILEIKMSIFLPFLFLFVI